MLSFKQINLHKAEQATVLLGQALEGCTHTVSLITEPFTIAGNITGLPRGSKSIYDRSDTTKKVGPRAGIIFSKDINMTALEDHSNRDCAAALATIQGKRTLIVSVYLDINKQATPPWLINVVNLASTKQWPIIMGIDTNAHSCLYGPDTNNRGLDIEDFISSHHLQVENFGLAPTFEVRRGDNHIQTHIDVTLTRDLTCCVQNWHVSRDYNGSDHNTILFQLADPDQEQVKIRPWNTADWKSFTESLRLADYKVPDNISMKKLDRLVQRMYAVLDQALDIACPLTTVTGKIHGSMWATEKHAVAKARVSSLYKKATASKKGPDWATYKKADRECAKKTKTDRGENIRNACKVRRTWPPSSDWHRDRSIGKLILYVK